MSNTNATKHSFQAEVKQVLDIVAHSIYKDRDIFLRELVSNASDALEKMRYTKLTEKEVFEPERELEITITPDEKAGTIEIADTGIGMTRDELVENLGTIAHSGTKAFLQKIKENGGGNENLIGQFGVGFFSAFMVADEVKFYTRSWKPEGESLCWTSDGNGEYTIETVDEALTRGSRLVVKLKDEYKDFSKKDKVKEVLERYSRYIAFPLNLAGEKLNTMQAIWLKSKSEVTEQEYKDFYKMHCHAWDEPLDWLHFSADAPLAINAILFFPTHNPEAMGFGRATPEVTLHCRKVLIDSEPKNLLPDWLRFMKGVVDSADLPLNISRETLQDSALIQKINRVLTKRVIKHLEEKAKKSPDDYAKFWKDFGNFLREGIATDEENRDILAPLFRCESSILDAGKLTSLPEYVERMKDSQKEIYYLVGANRESIEAGPYLEAFKSRGIEVLFLYDGTDDYVLNRLSTFKEKSIVSADAADIDLGDAPQTGTGEALPEDKMKSLCEWFQKVLGKEKVAECGAGARLVDSPAVALNQDKFMSASMRRVMRMMTRDSSGLSDTPVAVKVELNPRHTLIHQLDAMRDNNPELAQLVAEQIYDNTLVAAGLLENPRGMTKRIYTILEKLSGNTPAAK
ncbi:MAG: molecular chaperone HtpG [Opitutae bacterium]|nr:molecular chaperone HtpG [Opitutae bacterium]